MKKEDKLDVEVKEEIDHCCNKKHAEDIEHLDHNMPDEGTLCDLAEFFKVFADSTRIKILYGLGLTQSAVSHQLRILKQMRLVKYRKEGKTIYYSLDDDHIQSILNGGLEHVME